MLWPWAWLLILLLVLPALRPAHSRRWALALLASWALCGGLWLLPTLWLGPVLRWNWPGALLAAAGAAWLASQMQRRAGLSWAEMGLTWRQREGSLRPACGVAALALAAHALTLHFSSSPGAGLPPGTWLYQATLPGVMEELVFRGLGLALADRVWPPRWQRLGVRLGWGAVLVSAVFVLLHGPSPQALVAVLPAALLYLWLRAFTGSLVLPVLVHNAWNLMVVAALAQAAG